MLSKLPYETIRMRQGVIFATYSSLVSSSKGSKEMGKRRQPLSRLDQLVKWCGTDFEGCILFGMNSLVFFSSSVGFSWHCVCYLNTSCVCYLNSYRVCYLNTRIATIN